MAETTPIPRQLIPPPKTTGNIQQDVPILVDWIYSAYQTIFQSVTYINGQVEENPDISVVDLPNPQTSTIAQAQTTANQAYLLASQAKTAADNISAILSRNVSGTIAVADADDTKTVTFATAQPNANYTVFLQPKTTGGTPATDAFIIIEKTYTTGNFSFKIKQAPGSGNTITFDWHLMRNT